MSQGVRTTDCKKENLSAAEAGKANKLHNQLNNNSHGGGWSADLTTGKCHCTSTLPTACELETLSQKPTTGTSNTASCPVQGPQLLGHLPPQHPREHAPQNLPVLGLYTSPSLTSTLLKRTTPPSLGKGFWVSPAEKDTREGATSPGTEDTCSQANGQGLC